MRFRGGYNIRLQGRPNGAIKVMPEPEKLYLRLGSRRFAFSEVCVEEGQSVNQGQVLAKDPDNYGVPLLAPRCGTVRLGAVEGHIVLEDVHKGDKHADLSGGEQSHIVQEMGQAGIKRYKLLMLGAWQFFEDAYTGQVPDPIGIPQAVVVSTLSLEPYTARGDAQLHNRLLRFTKGLEHLQNLLEYQPIYLVMPDINSDFAQRVREQIRGYAWVKLIEVPLRYPYDDFNILARSLGLKKEAGAVWGLRTEGVLAADRALTVGKSCTVRIVSIGGPGVNSPIHLKVMAGYPIELIKQRYVSDGPVRIIDGGILRGQNIEAQSGGLDTECRGLTVLGEHTEREFLGFVRPGWDRKCYAACYLSSLRHKFGERLNTAVRGEVRPCISCNYCAQVCPAGILPHLIHKYLYSDLIDEARQVRVDLCVKCGLCSYLCPSKLELREQFIEAQGLIEQERQEAEAEEQRRLQEEAQRESEKEQV